MANITHEVRTPLNGVIAMAELLLGGDLAEQQRSGLEPISQSGSSLLTIINDILDYSKIEAGKMTIQPGPFDVIEAVEDVVALLSPEAAKRGNEVAFQFDPDLPRLLLDDHGRVYQITTNLLGNAIKFTNGGVVIVRLAGDRNGDDLNLVLEVEDSGVGIPPEHLDIIFQPFEQSAAEVKQNGTGLGLSICRQLASLMGGDLSATSAVEVGSVFRFEATFPVLDDAKVIETPFASGDCVALFGASPQAEALSAQMTALGAMITTDPKEARLNVISLLNDGAALAGLAFAPAAPAIIVVPTNVAPPEALINRFPKGARLLRRPVRTGILASNIRALIGEDKGRAVPANDRRRAPRAAVAPLVLVAEDNVTNAAIIRAILADQDYTVDIKSDAQTMIEAYERWPA